MEIGSDEFIVPNTIAVGAVTIATLTSFVNNLILTPVLYLINSSLWGVKSILTLFLYLGLMGIPFFHFFVNILTTFLLYVNFFYLF